MPHVSEIHFKERFLAIVLGSADLPKKALDRHILFFSATLSLEPGRAYAEKEIDDHLHVWALRFGRNLHLDHVSLRRYLVDHRYLSRDTSGRSYRLTPGDAYYSFEPSVRSIDLEALVQEEVAARDRKRQQYLQKMDD